MLISFHISLAYFHPNSVFLDKKSGADIKSLNTISIVNEQYHAEDFKTEYSAVYLYLLINNCGP